jgi:crossover junction endodeoxyribonuclease RuvC
VPRTTGGFPRSGIAPGNGPGTRIMGVDPGVVATGFGVVEMGRDGLIHYLGSGVVRPQRMLAFSHRLQQIYRGLCRQIEKFNPQLMAVESPFYAKNVKSAMLLGQARGVALLAAAEAGLEVQEYSPLEVKQAVVGYGRAGKEQVQAMIRVLLNPPADLAADAADALAVALCFAHSLPWHISLGAHGSRRFLHEKLSPAPHPNSEGKDNR